MAIDKSIRKGNGSRLWNLVLQAPVGYATLMKLMGRHLLHKLATSGTCDYAGPLGALCAELEAAEWNVPASALADYPNASLDGATLEIEFANGACVRLVINCGAGVVLIQYAG